MIVPTTTSARPLQGNANNASLTVTPNESLFRLALDTSQTSMLITDPHQADNPIIYANKAFVNLTGYSAAEILGRNCRFLQGPETDPTAIACIRQAMTQRREVRVELINYRKDGTPFWNEMSISPVFNDTHELTHFFASQKDITHQRAANEALEQMHKMQALGDLTGGIAHDFNNLLQVMGGYLDIIQRNASRPACNLQSISLSAASARTAAERATMLTRQLLAFSSKQRLEARSLNLNDVVVAAHRTGKHVTSGIRLQTELAPDLWNSHIDPVQTERAVDNILSNACDALKDRPNPNIRIQTANVAIQGPPGMPAWGGLLPGRYVSVAISDNGTGIAESILDRVIDPFFSTKGEGRGAGLGLSTVYGFALQSGGTVRIYSREGVGTTVRLYFPAWADGIAGAAADEPLSTPKNNAPHGTEAILIVEDRHDVAELARSVLKDYGYQPQIARSGDDAWVRLTDGEQYDLVFSDVVMPGKLNGVELARKIGQHYPATKVLLTTGFADNTIECTDCAGQRFAVLAKPYLARELGRRVRALLGSGPAQQPAID